MRPLRGGAERQAERLAQALEARGTSVTMLTLREHPDWPAFETINGLAIHRLAVADLSRWIRRGAGIPNTLLRCIQIRKGARPLIRSADIVHCHMATPFSAFVADASHRLGKPVICKVASGGMTFDLTTTSNTTLGGELIVRSMRRSISRWVALSSEIRANLHASGIPDRKIISIPNSVVPAAVSPLPPKGLARRFLLLARFTHDRDISTLLNAFASLQLTIPDVELALVGGGPLTTELSVAVAALPCAERTRVLGHSDSYTWLKWADVVVQPSRTEGMSNTLLEAMTAGRACIASDIPPNRELLEDGHLGLLFRMGDKASLTAAMTTLATTPGLAFRLASRAKQVATVTYDADRIAGRYQDLYHALCSGVGSAV
jgi:L-malate glycosyltransferase